MSVSDGSSAGPGPARYSPAARRLHWLIAAFILCLVPLGLYMVARGEATNFDAVTGSLYSLHKLLGFLVLWLIVLRVLVRLRRGAPPPVATLTPFERTASHAVHGALYLLLLIVPLLGWAGVSAYPALDVFGLFNLPAILPPDEALANRILGVHKLLALALAAIALVHIAAALRHRFLKQDGVMARMWPPG
ncbi:cytochrome b561 [Angulomicrobium tetraedrale]|uniref:Cytochrome b561 n=1 Tax=Ancylobacter tetraedralis TaxID=217068 RepID=A0A839Z9B1_9HYPH|nr:cytochrome b/b6 domain-containing protein [Ancylobacter tetraedralis]MBB3770477.1 cytochrome b561 [Ancylobacter tetraedralis]